MLAAAGAGQSVVASVLGLGAAGVAGGVIAMAWSLHVHEMQLASRIAHREAGRPADGADHQDHADTAMQAYAMNGGGGAVKVAGGNGASRSSGGSRSVSGTPGTPGAPGAAPGGQARPGPAPPSAIEGPDSVIIGEQARYRVRRSAAQQVVSWAAGGGALSQASDPAHPDDLLLVADRPGSLTVSVRLREGLAERRETKIVTAVPSPEAATPAIPTRMLAQDWPVITIAVLVVGFTAALVALGSIAVGDFIALVAPLTALLAVVATTRRATERPGQPPPR